jgi:hypothetical protein
MRPLFVPPDPTDRTVYAPGDIAQCDLWFGEQAGHAGASGGSDARRADEESHGSCRVGMDQGLVM